MPKLLTYSDTAETLAWTIVLGILRGDATTDPPIVADTNLQSCNPTITTYRDGLSEMEDTKPDPDAVELPYLRVWFAGCQLGNWDNWSEMRIDLSIGLNLWTAGTDERDLMNFYGAIRGAFFPADPTRNAVVDSYLRSNLFIGTLRMPRAMGKMHQVGRAAHGLKSSAMLTVPLLVRP